LPRPPRSAQIFRTQRSSERRKAHDEKRHTREADTEVAPERKRAAIEEVDS
jgi:hypothetical protein